MRLVVFGPGHPFRGGIAVTTTAAVAALQRTGHEVLFLTPHRQYPNWLFPGAGDFDPDACPKLACARPAFAPLEPWTWPRASRLARDFGADAWVVPYWTWAWAPFLHWVLASRRGTPALGVVHNPVDHENRWHARRASAGVLSRCDALFTHARALADGLEARFPGREVGAHLLPPVSSPAPASDDARRRVRSKLSLSKGDRLAVFAGLIRPYKGVDLAIEAVDALDAESPWRLHVAGEPWGGLADDLRRRHGALRHPERVSFEFVWTSESRLAELLAAADLAVLPYRAGSQSAMAPMALAAGTPLLTTAVGGLPELVDHDRCGLVVEPGSSRALARALAALDDATLARLAAGARERAAELTWDHYARTLIGMLAAKQ